MRRIKKLFVLCIFSVLLLLAGCGQKQEAAVSDTEKLNTGVEDFVYEDSYQFRPELIEYWTSAEGQAILDEFAKREEAKVLFIRGNLVLDEGNTEQALLYFKQCLKQCDAKNDAPMMAKCYYEYARQNAYGGDYDAVAENIQELQKVFTKYEDKTALVYLQAMLSYDIVANPLGVDMAINMMKDAVKVAREIEYEPITYILYQLAFVYAYTENTSTSYEYYIQALEAAEAENDAYWISVICCDIGSNYIGDGNFTKGLEFLKRSYDAIKDAEANRDYDLTREKINTMQKMVSAYLGSNDYKTAKQYLELYEELIDSEEAGKASDDDRTLYYATMADYYIAIAHYAEAKQYLDLAKERYEAEEYFYYTNFDIILLEAYGRLYLKWGRITKAMECYRELEQAYFDYGADSADITTLKSLYSIYTQLGYYDEAAEYADKVIDALEVRYQDKERLDSEYLMEQFQSTEREAEIEQLKYKNQSLNHILASAAAIVLMGIIFSITSAKKRIEIKRLNAKLVKVSQTDELTQLNNRRALNQYLEQNWKTLCEGHLPISMVMMDVDFFKLYNDTFGHQEGDRVLEVLAELLQKACTADDFATRYGGEEFLLIWPDTSAEQAVDRMNRVRSQLAELQIANPSSTVSDYVTISVGIASITETEDYLQVIHYADDALYRSKDTRNTITIY